MINCILSAELARRYKPDPEVYLTAAALLGLAPHQVMMVAAHRQDLAVGMHTAYVLRPLEYGPGQTSEADGEPAADLVVEDFHELADRLLQTIRS